MAKQAVVEEERDFTGYADKEPTGTMKAFADWLIDEVGLEFKTKAAEHEFREGVRLGGTLRMEFQASDFWKEHELNPRSPQNQNGKAKAAAKPARGRAASKPAEDEPAAEDEDEPAEDEAPAKPTRQRRGAAAKPSAAKSSAAKPTARRTGRRGAGASVTETSAEAPY